MDFIMGLPRTQSGYDSIWVIVHRLTKVAHFIPVKTTYSGTHLAKLYMLRIVCLHGVSKRGLRRFKVRGKLAPRLIGPFKILEKRGEVAYQLELPLQLSDVHDIFHFSQLRTLIFTWKQNSRKLLK
jgi:hypothetical protein